MAVHQELTLIWRPVESRSKGVSMMAAVVFAIQQKSITKQITNPLQIILTKTNNQCINHHKTSTKRVQNLYKPLKTSTKPVEPSTKQVELSTKALQITRSYQAQNHGSASTLRWRPTSGRLPIGSGKAEELREQARIGKPAT